MPGENGTHNVDESITVQSGTEQAEVLCFFYTNDDYGFQPADIREYFPRSTTTLEDALERLLAKDLIGKTHDGYYHALDDPYVATYADELAAGEDYTLDAGKEKYPCNV